MGKALKRILGVGLLASWPLMVGAAADGLNTGKQLFESRRYEEARKTLEPYAAANGNNAEAAFYLGRTYFALGKEEKATEWLEKAAELAPNRSEYQLWVGRAYGRAARNANVLRQAGLARSTKAAFEKAVELDPNNLEAREDLIEYYLEAPGLLGGSVDDALAQGNEIKKRDFVRGCEAIAGIHVHEDNLAAAEQELKAAVQKAPSDPRALMAIASFYQIKKQWNAAFDNYETILKANPSHYTAMYQLGKAGALSGQRLDRAEECLKRYLQRTPASDEPPLSAAHHRLGMVLEKKGNKAQARAEYQMALKLDPSLKDAKEALSRLK